MLIILKFGALVKEKGKLEKNFSVLQNKSLLFSSCLL